MNPMNPHAFVILLYDSVRALVLGKLAAAMSRRDELSAEYFEEFRHSFDNNIDTYKSRCLWHISEVGEVDIPTPEPTTLVLAEVAAERAAQDKKWGEQTRTRFVRLAIEACLATAQDSPDKLRAELIETAASSVAAVEALDRAGE